MKSLIAAAFLATASLTTLALADPAVRPEVDPSVSAASESATPAPDAVVKPADSETLAAAGVGADAVGLTAGPDARTVASDAEVGAARRAYRAQCQRVESRAFCECVTAGVAQALPPADVRLAARTVRERISAQGDAPVFFGADAEGRISQVEGHYADVCTSYRK